MKTILTLDLATNTGFALWEPGSKPRLGVNRIGDTGNDVGMFLTRFEEWLVPFVKHSDITDIFFEAAYVGSKTTQQSARKLFALGGFTEYLCRREKVRYFEMQVAQWRRHFIGGNPARTTAHKLTRERCKQLGIATRNQDEADAFGMLDYAVHRLKMNGADIPKPDWSCGALFSERGAA